MTIPAKGMLLVPTDTTLEYYEVQYNPTELSFDKQVQLAEIAIPGLDAPLQQFVRGNAERLTLELYCDTTEDGMGIGARSVTEETDKFFQLVKIVPGLHAPPVVTFYWNDAFPGNNLMTSWGNQRRNAFTGMAESVRQKFTLFSPEGVPLRANVTLVLREYRRLETQLYELNLQSPDRTHSHVLSGADTLSGVAGIYYQRSDEWRAIADANEIEDPRRLTSGKVLSVPKITAAA